MDAEVIRWVQLREIVRDSRVQPRNAINSERVAQYAADMAAIPVWRESGFDVPDFPPVVVFEERADDGRTIYWLADGWHRTLASEEVGLTAVRADVRPGDVYAAILFAAGANARTALPRTSRDKHRAVRMLLDHPQVIREQWSNARVAHAAVVSIGLVRTVRAERERELGLPSSGERAGRDGKVYALKRRGDDGSTSYSPGAGHRLTEPSETGVDSGAAGSDRTALLYECSTDGCDAVLTEPSWHCPSCGVHWPSEDYPTSSCPSCGGEQAARSADVIAKIDDREIPKPARNGTGERQAPYSPGTLKASGATVAYERLIVALDLIAEASACDPADVRAEAPDPAAFDARIAGARAWLALVAADGRLRVVR